MSLLREHKIILAVKHKNRKSKCYVPKQKSKYKRQPIGPLTGLLRGKVHTVVKIKKKKGIEWSSTFVAIMEILRTVVQILGV